MASDKAWQKSVTLGLRAFWHRNTLEAARDELVTSPPCPKAYDDAIQDEQLRSLIPDLKPGLSVIDFGCGVGRVTRALLRAKAKVTAIDVSESMLNYTKLRCEDVAEDRLKLLLNDGFGCPSCQGNAYDVAICMYVLQHQPSLELMEKICKDLHRCLRPEGLLIAQGSDHHSESNPSEIGFIGHRMSEWDYFDLLERCGFAIQDAVFIEPSQVILRAKKASG